MGWILTLECILPHARELLWPRPVMPGAKCPASHGPGNAYPLLKAPGRVDRVPGPCPESRREARWADRW
jgi:hypothetical protein